MTHWKRITPETHEFTDSSYQRLHTPSEYMFSEEQKVRMAEEAQRKAQLRKAWSVSEHTDKR